MRIDDNPQGAPAMVQGSDERPQIRRLGWRAIGLGFFFAVLICAVTPFNNAYRQATPLGGGHFPLAPFFIMSWLFILVGAARKFTRKRLWLRGNELIMMWVLMVLVSGIAYTGLVRTFFINMTAPYHFATVGNRWKAVLHPFLPQAWYPQQPEAIEGLYNGLPGGSDMSWWELFTRIPWHAWLPSLLSWFAFVFLCYGVMLCLINLLSRQWIHNERMNFPLLQVPRMMEEALDQNAVGRFLTNHYLLTGLSIPLVLHLINGLHFYYPVVPQIPTLILAGPYFPKQGLFSGFYKLKIYLYPAFIGFAFLTSRQISFSFWLFFIFGGLLYGLLSVLGYNIPAAALGVTFGPTLTHPQEMQMIGAYGVFFLFMVWLARHHLLDVSRQAMGLQAVPPARTEWFSARLAFWGAVLGMLGLVLWCWFFGMPLTTAVFTLMAFWMVMLVATRIVCQGGVAYFTLTAAPIDGLLAFFGPGFFGSVGILMAAVIQKVLFVDLRECLMPSLLHASDVTHGNGNRRRVFGGIVVTLLAGVVVSFTAMLMLCYRFGIRELGLDWASRTTVAVYENVQTLVETPVQAGNWVLIFSVVGAVVMLVLVTGYYRFYWWPIHPIGYLTAYSSAMRILWVSFFIGWICNTLCMRYGGIHLFKKLRYFFIGLIIGDFMMGGIWAVIGLFSDASYNVLPT
jgi:hypothetical protein